jgi:hypothetical protein
MTFNKIQKRPLWSTYSQPRAPQPPSEPKEYLKSYQEFHRTTSYISLKELQLPEGKTLEDVFIERNCDCSSGGDIELTFSVMVSKLNDNYQTHLKHYYLALDKYEIAKEQFQQELKEWHLWRNQEERDELDRQLKHAADLLKKHGKL